MVYQHHYLVFQSQDTLKYNYSPYCVIQVTGTVTQNLDLPICSGGSILFETMDPPEHNYFTVVPPHFSSIYGTRIPRAATPRGIIIIVKCSAVVITA